MGIGLVGRSGLSRFSRFSRLVETTLVSGEMADSVCSKILNRPVHGLEQLLALRRGPRGQGNEVVVVDVHSFGRPVSVLEEERGVLRLRAVLSHRRRRRPHVPGAHVVLHREREGYRGPSIIEEISDLRWFFAGLMIRLGNRSVRVSDFSLQKLRFSALCGPD